MSEMPENLLIDAYRLACLQQADGDVFDCPTLYTRSDLVPSWQDRPTCEGMWMDACGCAWALTAGEPCENCGLEFRAHHWDSKCPRCFMDQHGERCRFYGPIPPDEVHS